MSENSSHIYGARLLDLLSSTMGQTMTPIVLGEGYSIAFYADYDVDLGYCIYYKGQEVVHSSLGYLDPNLYPDERTHILAVTRLLYAQADVIVERYMAYLKASRPAAEAQLAKEMQA